MLTSFSASAEQRELEKRRLEIGYKDTGKVIDNLVAGLFIHSFNIDNNNLTKVISISVGML